MEILGTNFAITLGSWRLCFRLALEDIDAPMPPKPESSHHVRIVEEEPRARRRASAN